MNAFPSLNTQPPENRGRIIRMALIYTPITLISLGFVGLALFQIASGETGFIFMLVIFGTVGFLTGFQAYQFLKDLSSSPVEYQGEVVKKWHKGNLLIFFLPSFYVAIDSRILNGRVTRVEHGGCYITMENGGEGYVPRKELGTEEEPVAPSAQDMVYPGDQVKYKVTGIDGRGGYKLSCRKAEEGNVVTRLFSVPRVEYAMLLEHDLVKITCFPHSSTVERIERYDDIEKKFIPATDGSTF